ncbi:MAG: CopD family protein [Alphaproteobacteria bacterium]|jgi:putative membrane protein|nr:CopD family protein [Alphaproteobacteria bacterium]
MSGYLLVKATHVVFVIALMAGLLMAPRLRIYQLSARPGEPLFETMREASRRLRLIILNPALIFVWILGIAMIWMGGWTLLSQTWFQIKLVLVLVLSGIHGFIISVGKKVDAGGAGVSEKRLRMMNELPFVLMIGVVFLAILKPGF